jgi:hypothetical protein
MPMNSKPLSNNFLLEIEQQLNRTPPPVKRKKPKRKREKTAKAQAYDFNEPIELQYNPSYHVPSARTAPSSTAFAPNQGIVLPLEFGGALNSSSAMYYVEPFEESSQVIPVQPADTLMAAPGTPPAPTEILLKTAIQPLNPLNAVVPSVSAPTKPSVQPGSGFDWENLESKLSPSSSQEQSLAVEDHARDFMDDLRAVISGQKQVGVTEPQAGQPTLSAATPAPPAAPQHPAQEGPHAIFDQMGATGLSFATTYNLAPMALEERFNAFDQSLLAAQPKPVQQVVTPALPVAPSSMPSLERMDLIEDFSYMSEAATASTLSGASWYSQFPTSVSLDDLAADFRDKMKAFVAALSSAGATHKINATRRPKERAYLMHWAWRIAKQNYDASKVTPMAGVNINWNHGDQATSRRAAQEMVDAYAIDNLKVEPALNSHHIAGNAADMEVSWSGDLSIKKADGTTRTITSQPRDHTNADLIDLAKTYGVIHYIDVSADKVHWSIDGR